MTTGGAPLPIIYGGTGSTTSAGARTNLGINIIDITVPGAYPYNILLTDYIIAVDTTGSARTIRLPNAATTGQVFIIKDNNGNAQANNITLTTVGGAVTIDGETTQIMNAAWISIAVYFNGTSYRII